MKKLYIADLDGTLLNNDCCISKKSAKIINDLTEKGMLFSIATARSVMTASEFLSEIKLSAPVVLMNGVFVYDTVQNKSIKFWEIKSSVLSKLLKIYEKNDKTPLLFLYGDDGLLSIHFTDMKLCVQKDFYNARVDKFDGRFKKVAELTIPNGQHAVYINLVDTYDELKPIYDEIMMLDGVTASFYHDNYTEYWFLEAYSDEASKANGARFVKEATCADKIVAFGDNFNDTILFECADECYAVENAVDELKNIATCVIGSNQNDGVAEFLKDDFKPFNN
ncbi:MAG: HAD-IIB family hydrolase [Oscillospiraceae bacterium]